MPITKDQIIAALSRVQDPELHKDLVTLGMIKNVDIHGSDVRLGIELTTPACPMKDQIKTDVEKELRRAGVSKIEIDWSAQVRSTMRGPTNLPGVKNIIAVGAGKGGVGKSTIAVLSAVGLARDGAKVGLLDADVYGPSTPKMMGVEAIKPMVRDDKILPVEAHGIRMMSMGFMVPPEQALIWRGPMAQSAMKQLLEQANWGELDYLIVDLPPGTGDIPLSLAQAFPITGAVIVATPQAVALLDATRALRMYQQLNVEILGIVENMSYFTAPDTGKEYDLFGRGGAKSAAERLKVPFLGEIPINVSIRTSGDAGTPLEIFDKADPATRNAVTQFVRNLAGQVSMRSMMQQAPVELKIT